MTGQKGNPSSEGSGAKLFREPGSQRPLAAQLHIRIYFGVRYMLQFLVCIASSPIKDVGETFFGYHSSTKVNDTTTNGLMCLCL